MQDKLLFLMTTFTALFLTATLALAQSANCGPHAAVVERLAVGFSESRQVMAINGDNGVLEVFASLESGTWTITLTRPGGPTCIVAAGQHYQHLAEGLPNFDQDA